MGQTAVGGRVRTVAGTAVAVVGIVLASLIGLGTWADAAATDDVHGGAARPSYRTAEAALIRALWHLPAPSRRRYNVCMATVHLEVESKYDAADEFEVPSLVELFGRVRGHAGVAPPGGTPWAEGAAAEQDLHATYFDTAELDLAAADLTLRR